MSLVTDIKEFLNNKNIVIVGNSVEMTEYDNSEFIDSHDVVVRLGRGAETSTNLTNGCVGKKTDIWATGPLRAPMWQSYPELFRDTKFIFYNRNRLHYERPETGPGQNNKFKFPRNKVINMYSQEELVKLNHRFGIKSGDKNDQRLSNGIITIMFFCDKVKKYKNLDIIGFDFFKKSTNKIRANSKDIHHSWHRPIKIVPGVVHSSERETEIVNNYKERGLLNWIVLSDLKEENIIDTKYGDF